MRLDLRQLHCLEPSCQDYKKRGGENLKPHGEAAGPPRFRCVTCGHAFTERHCHPLFPLRTDEATIARVLLALVRGKSIHEAAADAGVDKNTVLGIIRHMGGVNDIFPVDVERHGFAGRSRRPFCSARVVTL